MGKIARAWDQMSDEEKLAELREPTITRCLRSYAPDDDGDGDNNGDKESVPVVTCGRDQESECGMKDPTECAIHAPPKVGGKSRRKGRSKSPRKGEFLKTFEGLVVSIRRKAMDLNSLEERAALVDRYWRDLQKQFKDGGIAPEFAAVVRQCLYSETIAWHWFGSRLDYPPGEG
jgi:hypothetical protein